MIFEFRGTFNIYYRNSQMANRDLCRLRELCGLTKDQAADLVRTSLRMWNWWETGDRNIPDRALDLLLIKTKPMVEGLDKTVWNRLFSTLPPLRITKPKKIDPRPS